VSVRRLGVVQFLASLSQSVGHRAMGHLRAASGMRTLDRRGTQEGSWHYDMRNGERVKLRISSIPVVHGDSFAIHIVPHDPVLRKIDGLGLLQSQFAELQDLLSRPGGLILFAGPTGCGKTTSI